MIGTLPLPEVPDERVDAALAERTRLQKLSRDRYQQYADAQPRRGAAMVARDRLAAFDVAPEEMADVQAVADQLPRFRALVNQGLRGHQDAERQLKALLIREHAAFVCAAERHVADVREAAAALEGPLRAYLDAWEKAADAYGSFERATVATIAAGDEFRDEGDRMWRAPDTIRAEAVVAECPLPADAVELVHRVMPRPKVYGD